MAAITEDDIEQAILQILENGELGYEIIRCSPEVQNKDNLKQEREEETHTKP